jgi:hypothetical protein
MKNNAIFFLALIMLSLLTLGSAQIVESKTASVDANGTSILRGWNQFVENINSSSDVLDKAIQGNISNDDAMALTTSIFVLNSQAISDLAQIKPSKDYAKFKNSTINGMVFFNKYLINMAKYFETKDGRYVLLARDYFNKSQEYYAQGRDEAEFLY